MLSICGCIEAYTVALACAEAMEHNAVVGKECRYIGESVKRLVSEEEFDELVFEHDWLEQPISEPIAGLAFAIALRDIREKCHADTTEIKQTFQEGVEGNNKSHYGVAQTKFIDVKTKLMNMAVEICKGSQ